ncbi:MSCRAMM family protein [Arcanobacterium pinnipediorum]|uniref:SpaA isopeptide-forming pilin-related protein n=1 Tax=Arcanobacterium pinnipediorum TaxID=1503041 RepID=A0ABY5AJ70_9ACTO|nr:SpaA isopeptide-forming pilin-related protein [Arcanobacterium pinnipediorum]USR79486.1 SpaA isopeptide-forming pilin-related protein [Arcanobacterium pinnipediorum]
MSASVLVCTLVLALIPIAGVQNLAQAESDGSENPEIASTVEVTDKLETGNESSAPVDAVATNEAPTAQEAEATPPAEVGSDASSDEPEQADAESPELNVVDDEDFFGSEPLLAVRAAVDDPLLNAAHVCNDGDFFTLGSRGAVRYIKYDPVSKTSKVVQTMDIPFGTFKWSNNNDGGIPSPSGVNYRPEFPGGDDAYFDGLAVSGERIFALSQKSNESANANGAYDEGVVIYEYETGPKQWYVHTRNGRVENSWGTQTWDGETIYKDRVPQGSHGINSSPIKPTFSPRYGNADKTNTFSKADTNFLAGVLYPDGTYVFGGTTGIRNKKDNTSEFKTFARKPDGTIVYLGHTKISASHDNVTGDYVVGENGDLYIATVSQTISLFGQPGTYEVSLTRLAASDIRSSIDNPVATWNPARSNWYSSGNRIFDHSLKNRLGTTPREITSDPVFSNVTFKDTTAFKKFTMGGLSVSSTGKVVVSVYGTEIVNYETKNTYTRFYQFDPKTADSQNFVDADALFDNDNYTPVNMWQIDAGSSNKGVTDMTGCPIPLPRVSFKVDKDISGERYSPADQFEFSAALSTGEEFTGATTGTTTGPREVIAEQKAPVGSVLTLTERFTQGAVKENYTTTLTCRDEAGKTHNPKAGTTNEYELTDAITGVLTCTFVNTAKPKPTYEFKIHKVLQTDNGNIAGNNVEFGLYRDNNGTRGALIEKKATNAQGNTSWTNLTAGQYWLVETRAPEGYLPVADKKYLVDKDTVVNGVYTAPDIVNLPNTPGILTIEKVDSSDVTSHLAGSEWSLEKFAGNSWQPYLTIVDDVSATTGANTIDRDNRAGYLKVEKLPLGQYRLTETRSPVGYTLPVDAQRIKEFTVTTQDFRFEYKIQNERFVGPTLPLTGGLGRDLFLFGGYGVLIVAATVMLVFGYRRTKTN